MHIVQTDYILHIVMSIIYWLLCNHQQYFSQVQLWGARGDGSPKGEPLLTLGGYTYGSLKSTFGLRSE